MRFIETTVYFTHPNLTFASELIADLFYREGLSGVVIEDPTLTPQGDGWQGQDMQSAVRPAVIGYIPMDGHASTRLAHIRQHLTVLEKQQQVRSQVRINEIDEVNWAESWKAFFHVQRIGSNMIVKPSWEDYQPNHPDELVIEIDPGQAFGTGTHPTTALCMVMMQKYLKPGDAVLDVGTGSGILLITASRLGAEYLCGVDSDSLAVHSAAQNLSRNAVNPRNWKLIHGHLTKDVDETFDFVVANILSDTVMALANDIHKVLRPNGIFIVSGIFEDRGPQVATHLASRGFAIVETIRQAEWVCVVTQRLMPTED